MELKERIVPIGEKRTTPVQDVKLWYSLTIVNGLIVVSHQSKQHFNTIGSSHDDLWLMLNFVIRVQMHDEPEKFNMMWIVYHMDRRSPKAQL